MAKILIVDDERLNRELLHAYLDGLGHELLDAATGEEALDLQATLSPDLVLLDVMLPGLSGFETLERLRVKTRGEFLPVVLITALDDQASRLRGMRAGADDFLTKPVDRHILLARVSNLLSLRAKEVALLQRNVELAELQRFRDEMSAMIVHDLKNPLSVILSNLDFVLAGYRDTESDEVEALRDSRAAGHRALRMLHNLLDVAGMEAGKVEIKRTRMPMARWVEPLVHQRGHLARSRDITLECRIDDGVQVHVDLDLVSRAVDNVLDNALRHAPPGGRIVLRGRGERGKAQLLIGNNGEPIAREHHQRIFEKFGQGGVGVGRMNLGLGLYFCRLALEAHGGRIWIEQTEELPTVFVLELPT